jgi:COP9 signalosome complex subunit 3
MNETTGLSSKISYRDYLRYFLYGGMIYLALKEWRKASHFLGTVISMPTMGSVSMIMVEAYKKWILVGLLEKGKVSERIPSSVYG